MLNRLFDKILSRRDGSVNAPLGDTHSEQTSSKILYLLDSICSRSILAEKKSYKPRLPVAHKLKRKAKQKKIIAKGVFLALDKLYKLDSDPVDGIKPSGMQSFYSFIIPPNIRWDEYLKRLVFILKIDLYYLIPMMVYLDRFLDSTKGTHLSGYNIYRLMLVSLLLVLKLEMDKVYNNACVATVGGVLNKELNTLEVKLLALFKCDLVVSPRLYDYYFQCLHDLYMQLVINKQDPWQANSKAIRGFATKEFGLFASFEKAYSNEILKHTSLPSDLVKIVIDYDDDIRANSFKP